MLCSTKYAIFTHILTRNNQTLMLMIFAVRQVIFPNGAWVPDEQRPLCFICNESFTLFNRKHRKCIRSADDTVLPSGAKYF